MRAIFMGTPEIAAKILDHMLKTKTEIIAVVTQSDKQSGRGMEMNFSPVKKRALEAGIPVLQPEKASAPEFIEQIKELNPDVILVAAYGKILRKQLLELPKYGCINVHASLLPKYRGAAPIQWAVINGDEKTGVTIMHMDEGLDTGDMIISKEVEIAPDETAGSLHDKLAEIGGPLLEEALELVESGKESRTKQDDSKATKVQQLDKMMGNIDFKKSAVCIERLIRGLDPWPSAYTKLDGKMVKFYKAKVLNLDNLSKEQKLADPGTVLYTDNEGMAIMTGDGILFVTELQMEGKKRMKVADFLRGYKLADKKVLGI